MCFYIAWPLSTAMSTTSIASAGSPFCLETRFECHCILGTLNHAGLLSPRLLRDRV